MGKVCDAKWERCATLWGRAMGKESGVHEEGVQCLGGVQCKRRGGCNA